MNDINKIVKRSVKLGIVKALKIYKQGRKHSYQFSAFTDIDKTYSIIHKLWVNVSPYAKEEGKSSEDDDAIDETMSMNRTTNMTERAKTDADIS